MQTLVVPRLRSTRDPLAAAVDRAAQQYRWSQQQRDIVRLCVEGVPLKCVGDRLEVSTETVKTQLRRLRTKARAPDTESLVMQILHDAISGRRG
ncbi:MAG: hypothetical protein JNK05_05640 [Myxococcales bacterium]|nr:hypothetical protein [Myxococcales bacterium]